MIWNLVEIAVQVGLLYVPLVLGIYLAMGVMSLPDLTLQGSFGVGGSTAAVLAIDGHHPVLSLGAAMLAGAATGLVTAVLHMKLRLNVLLASILVATAAYSMCLVIMSSGNLSLFGTTTAFSWAADAGLTYRQGTIVTGAVVAALLCAVLLWFLHTDYGLSLVATGQNIQTARGLGVRTELRQAVGLAVANALAALSGGLVVHNQGFMDVTIQNGVIVIGLAGMMLGLSFTRSSRILPIVLALVAGVVVYRFAVATSLQIGLDPNLLQLLTAAVVVVVIAVRSQGRSWLSALTTSGRRQRRISRTRFYEEDRVASFI
ncbi:ABC transporter permease [Nocardioides humi]|uniref:ABC transporter permease n=1 Tax=Nocardioides humi TaxID=449461 RepID=A0ABN2BEL3_9ACTN|nr:ABC transporter permease [Nocardioides humi]